MRQIIMFFLSLLALSFSIWSIWLGYNTLKGELQDSGILELYFVIIIFLVLTATYFIASSIQKGAEIISQKTEEASKTQFYKEVLGLLSDNIFEDDLNGELPALDNLKMLLALRSPQKILEAVNNLERLKSEGASMTELKDAMIQLILMIRTEIGQHNYAVKKELQLLLKEPMRK